MTNKADVLVLSGMQDVLYDAPELLITRVRPFGYHARQSTYGPEQVEAAEAGPST